MEQIESNRVQYLGIPKYNLFVTFKLAKMEFSNINQIEKYGKIIRIAKNYFGEGLAITDQGFLTPALKTHHEAFKADLDIDDNLESLLNLDNVIKGVIEPVNDCYYPHLAFEKNIYYVKPEGNNIYLPDFRSKFNPEHDSFLLGMKDSS